MFLFIFNLKIINRDISVIILKIKSLIYNVLFRIEIFIIFLQLINKFLSQIKNRFIIFYKIYKFLQLNLIQKK